MCGQGAKMVVLITGKCPTHCFYCPLSTYKQNRDVIYADEWMLAHEDELEILILEAEAINAQGAGITGGDPLMEPKRTINYIRFLKESFGKQFHIHLYTSGLIHTDAIQDMVSADLDEIRFHPEPRYWSDMGKSPLQEVIAQLSHYSIDIAIEIPAIPGRTKDIINLVSWAESQQLHYINLNELEFSELNETALYKRGFTMKDDLSAAAQESQETAFEVLSFFETQPLSIGIHYCSSSFKDGVQLTNRLKRRARTIATNQDIITKEGTLIKGILEPNKNQTLESIELILRQKLKFSICDYIINKKRNRIELHPTILREYASLLTSYKIHCFIIEEYPTADHLEVERMPV
ncbi:MAG: radical SAM protein [Candidatus Thermoplasmatota archaeon]|nr:radical SAM protein [Candidatus Thermoplasmatota archaeon]